MKGYYHGVAPWSQKLDLTIPFNDLEALRHTLEQHAGQLAGLIAQADMHGNLVDNALLACSDHYYGFSADQFARLGTRLTTGLVAAAHDEDFTLVSSGEPALFYLRLADDHSLMLHQEWVAECVQRGVFITSHHNHFINAALTETDVDMTIDIARHASFIVRKRHPLWS
ncbi:hypothetical protein [Cryobacterium sp. GrIS_2_6]|uniref:hypothetical protein n=1 Tax=Cryobacterium sp. GrIS_2_6 TaxID=3162785 RepID=UPI002DFAC90E|nr:glutamate-1-semialdehyde aminotransferase [Cryobacterium psychrotolerans]